MSVTRPIDVGTAARGAAACGAVLVLAGCGSSSDYANTPRPPVPITVTAAIIKDRVLVSPARFGAGPITLVVTNQTPRSQELTFETSELGGTQSGVRQRSGPINPQSTATLKADVRQGTYTLRARSGVRAARITVGRRRASAQNQLLQP
jgi:hypothetical protein